MRRFCVFLLCLSAALVWGETLRTPDGYCYISKDAVYKHNTPAVKRQSGLFSYYPFGSFPLRPVVQHADQVERGALLRIRVGGVPDLDRLQADLLNPDGERVSSAVGFLPQANPYQIWMLFVAVPHYVGGGAFTLDISGRSGGRSFHDLYRIRVHQKRFIFEDIRFNENASALMLDNSPRRLKESRLLQRILLTFRPQAQFHTGRLILPVQSGRISSHYGDRRQYHFTDGGSSLSLHNGLDLAVPTGTPVAACASGQVVLATERFITGNTVVLEHYPGVFSLYYHLHSLAVKTGDPVVQGDLLGTVGMTGVATGPHLHWELRVSGVAVDPEPFLNQPFLDADISGWFSLYRFGMLEPR